MDKSAQEDHHGGLVVKPSKVGLLTLRRFGEVMRGCVCLTGSIVLWQPIGAMLPVEWGRHFFLLFVAAFGVAGAYLLFEEFVCAPYRLLRTEYQLEVDSEPALILSTPAGDREVLLASVQRLDVRRGLGRTCSAHLWLKGRERKIYEPWPFERKPDLIMEGIPRDGDFYSNLLRLAPRK